MSKKQDSLKSFASKAFKHFSVEDLTFLQKEIELLVKKQAKKAFNAAVDQSNAYWDGDGPKPDFQKYYKQLKK